MPMPMSGAVPMPTVPNPAPPQGQVTNTPTPDVSALEQMRGYEGFDRAFPRVAAQMDQTGAAAPPAGPPPVPGPTGPRPTPFPTTTGRPLPASMAALGSHAFMPGRGV